MRKNEGHLADIVLNRKRMLDLVVDRKNRVDLGKHGNMWYAKTESDGTQLWASVRIENSEIQNCGLNIMPREVSPTNGLNRPLKVNYKGKNEI